MTLKNLPVFFAFLVTSIAFAQQGGPTATVQVDSARVVNGISPRMYAAFTEMMAEDIKRGLTAEMLLDRSFEQAPDTYGLPAQWKLEPDERNDNVGAIKFLPTASEAYPSVDMATHEHNHALQITLAPGDITDARRGFSQGRLSFRAGQGYAGYFWAKIPAGDGYSGNVRVALEEDNTDGKTYAETSVTGLKGDWRQYRFSLTPNTTDRFGKLSLLFDGRGTLLLDQMSLELADARSEVRPDSEAMIASLHPSFIRWPGGNVAQDYHWQWGVGPRDLRPVWINKSWSNAAEPDDFGTEEYLAFCERLGIQPSITVNVDGDGATPAEAAAWVEYVNGPVSSKYGAMRAANGHPAPYNVRQWELGNEIFGGWVRGHVSAEDYARAAVRYAEAMRAVDPHIQLIAVGEGVFRGSEAWNSAVLRIAGSQIQYLAVHDYTSRSQNAHEADPRSAMMARPREYEDNYRHMGDLIAQLAPGRHIKLIVNEWNLFYDAQTIQSMEGAVYASRMMNGFERDGGIVEANCISDLLNGWVGGILQASRDRIYGTPEFYALQMYSSHLGTERLYADVHSPNLHGDVPAVDAVATRSADGSTIFVKLSNADPVHAISARIDILHADVAGDANLDRLTSVTSSDRNTFEKPEAVVSEHGELHCQRGCVVDLPPDAVAVLTLRAKAQSSNAH